MLGHAQRQDRYGRNWRVEDKESIKRTFDVSASSGPQKLLVDNLNGYIHVTGYSGQGNSGDRPQTDRSGFQRGGGRGETGCEARHFAARQLRPLYVDGPFRSNNGVSYRGDDYYGYRVYSTMTFRFRSLPS